MKSLGGGSYTVLHQCEKDVVVDSGRVSTMRVERPWTSASLMSGNTVEPSRTIIPTSKIFLDGPYSTICPPAPTLIPTATQYPFHVP